MSFKEGYRTGKAVTEALLGGIAKFFQFIFHGGARAKRYSKNSEIRDLMRLYDDVQSAYQRSAFFELDAYEHACEIAISSCCQAGHEPSEDLLSPFVDIALWLYANDGFAKLPEVNWEYDLTSHYDILELRKKLRRLGKLFGTGRNYLELWTETLGAAFHAIFNSIPRNIDLKENQGPFHVELVNILKQPAQCIEEVLGHLLAQDSLKAGLFDGEAEKAYSNALQVSGINPEDHSRSSKPIIYPTESKLNERELIESYLGGTAFEYLLTYPHSFEIPNESRFEHCHILAGTGHGKTQLIQTLILEDLKNHTERGFCVIDSQGDLIKKLSMNYRFATDTKESLFDKFIMIDPTDVEFPVCLNMFALNQTEVHGNSPANREMIINSTVELYSYMFGALFGAELTQRQGLIFQYLARLMMQIPDATIQTLREILEDGRKFVPYMEKLGGSSQAFFKTQFFSTQFNQTKRQVLARLWSILSNATLERTFSHVEQKVDLYEAMNSGKIVLINTAKDLLGKEGSQILGRFFIALLGQAIIKRSAIPESGRNPFYVYIDEAHEYFDENIEQLLNQARKYRVGLTLSHQNIDQLGRSLRAAVMSSTSIKLAGGLSSNDAAAIAQETRSKKEEILAVRKREGLAEFACWIKNATETPVILRVPFGLLENEPILSEEAYTRLIESNRSKYCVKASSISFASPSPTLPETIRKAPSRPAVRSEVTQAPPRPLKPHEAIEPSEAIAEEVTVPAPEQPIISAGKGGPQHRYLQNLVKKIAQERGYKATVEESVLGGEGGIVVAIEGYSEKIACEITVTTSYAWEVQNILKCLAAGYDKVIAISSDAKKLNGLRRFAQDQIKDELDEGKILFFDPTALISYLDKKRAEAASEEKTVRGYSVKVNYSAISSDEAKSRREAIAKIILKSSKSLDE